MNIETFFQHHGIHENPFRAEEARQDTVFTRIETACHHPDYKKIRGEFDHPSSAVVFGERGSGKTALRMQIEHEVRQHNMQHPGNRCLVIDYDDLNPILDRLHYHVKSTTAEQTLESVHLVDHLDGILATIVPRIVDQAIGDSRSEPVIEAENLTQELRQLDPGAKRDLLLLQLCYDRPQEADLRTKQLKRAIRAPGINWLPIVRWTTLIALLAGLAMMAVFFLQDPQEQRWLWILGVLILLGGAAGLAVNLLWTWFKSRGAARSLASSLRVQHRLPLSFRRSIETIGLVPVLTSELPESDHDDPRYEMVQRLRRVLHPFGYRSIIVLIDRIDEPTLINGEPQRMKKLIWPLFNNKFLQQDQFGAKILLPLDLKHLLFKESAEFFREARLDKQNMVERLTWSGAVLYDICTARLNACRADGNISLRDLFEDDVSHQDLVDDLDQMQQPRDAFKMLYQTIQAHCTNIPEETPQYKIPKLVLDSARREQVERLGGMLRGHRPA